MIANLNRANVFIDCQIGDKNEVIVVAEAIPINQKSLYNTVNKHEGNDF
ncbi:histidine kinase N-terminal domain-containing protein [Mammaliicoccus sp. Dog046]|nr:histidine kinase N-terminal domain-containing protein [Mammaliicoccus sp. Dog046]WQK86674.1 hypothetical protein P3U32_00590 [Mammaliicoccus sp. Dog046]